MSPMKCLDQNCTNDALEGSNYCSKHRPKNISVVRFLRGMQFRKLMIVKKTEQKSKKPKE